MEKAIEILKNEFKKCRDYYNHYMKFVNDVTFNPEWKTEAENNAENWKRRAQQTDFLIYLLEKENEKADEEPTKFDGKNM